MPKLDRLVPHFQKIWDSNWYSNFGQYTKELEKNVADFYEVDADRVVTCSNATVGLMMAIKSFKWTNPAIVPSYTFPATVQALQWNNIPYHYVDIHHNTHHAQVEVPTWSTFAQEPINLLYVFPYGCPKQLDCYNDFHSVIVDAAASFGNKSEAMMHTLNNADATVFSLHATKVMGIGEGAVVIFFNKECADRFRRLSNFGLTEDKDVVSGGMNGKMCELLAAVGVEKLKTFDDILDGLSNASFAYKHYLKGIHSHIHLYDDHPWQFVPVFIPIFLYNDIRDDVISDMRKDGIVVEKYYRPMHRTCNESFYSLPITGAIAESALSLPIYPDMTGEDVAYIVHSLRRSIRQRTQSSS